MTDSWADKAIEDMKASYEAELAALRDRIEELEMQLVLSKPLYSRRQLEARIAKLEKALEPFAEEAACYDPDTGDGDDTVWATPAYFKIRDLRRARAALDQDKGGGNE